MGEFFSAHDLEEALAQAQPDAFVYADFAADWCEPCHELSAEVLVTSAGNMLVHSDVAVRVDVESPKGQQWHRDYGVKALPAVLLLDAQGRELGRVEGYEGAQSWLEEMSLLKRAWKTAVTTQPRLLQQWRSFKRSGDALSQEALEYTLKEGLRTQDAALFGSIGRAYARHVLRRQRQPEKACEWLRFFMAELHAHPQEMVRLRLSLAIAEASLHKVEVSSKLSREWSVTALQRVELEWRYGANPMTALQLVRELQATHQGAPWAYWHWKAALSLGFVQEAQDALERALVLAPEHPTYRYAKRRMEAYAP